MAAKLAAQRSCLPVLPLQSLKARLHCIATAAAAERPSAARNLRPSVFRVLTRLLLCSPLIRPAGPRVGGLSMAFSGDGSGKKRGLASLNASAPADALAAAYGGTDSGSQQQQQQQLAQQKQSPQQQQQHSKLPVGGLSTHFGSGQFSVGSCAATEDNFLQHLDSGFAAHSPAPSPLSPLSEALQLGPGSAQRSPLSDALAIASCPRRKVLPVLLET